MENYQKVKELINYEINELRKGHFSKEELGFAIGREEVKIIAITDKNMAEKLMFLYRENSATN